IAGEYNKIFFSNDCCYKGMSMRLLYCVFFLYAHILSGTEYIYPVASLNNGATVLCIHQHNPTHIELVEWNPSTNHAEQILWSMFNPAGLQLLPNNAGFSFIDNGRLRIKLFQKRSPKAIDFDEPLFGINGLQWIDQYTCYCSAYYNNNFALFELHDDGTMHCLCWKKGSDYLYPQKIGEQLFYIERYIAENSTHYRIMQCAYENNNNDAFAIVDFYSTPIIFLTMISDKHGFVLEHAQNIDSDNSIIPFSYHEIIKQGDTWSKNILFSFSIPTDLLVGDTKLYESLLPLLPRIVDNKIYFIDCAPTSPRLRRAGNDTYNLEPYFYDLSFAAHPECPEGVYRRIQKISLPEKKGHYFVPMQCGNGFYCGGTLGATTKLLVLF
ncbi:MAG TPA: hypothetical protein VKR58_10680, partial [Aquella sp.]|nr:hypothetical protein [Aquella sp.]